MRRPLSMRTVVQAHAGGAHAPGAGRMKREWRSPRMPGIHVLAGIFETKPVRFGSSGPTTFGRCSVPTRQAEPGGNARTKADKQFSTTEVVDGRGPKNTGVLFAPGSDKPPSKSEPGTGAAATSFHLVTKLPGISAQEISPRALRPALRCRRWFSGCGCPTRPFLHRRAYT